MTTNTEVSSNTVLMKAVDKTKLVVVIGLDDNNKLYIDSNRLCYRDWETDRKSVV